MRNKKSLEAVVTSHGGLVLTEAGYEVTVWLRVTSGPTVSVGREVTVTVPPALARTIATSLNDAAERADTAARALAAANRKYPHG